MIGVSKAVIRTNSVNPPAYGVFLTPSLIIDQTGNGGYTTSFVDSNINGGVGPYLYEWSSNSGIFTPNSPDSDRTSFSGSGYNREVFDTCTLKVTDEGNGDLETEATIEITVFFGVIN